MFWVREIDLRRVEFEFADLPILENAFIEDPQRYFHGLYLVLGELLGLEEEVLAPVDRVVVIGRLVLLAHRIFRVLAAPNLDHRTKHLLFGLVLLLRFFQKIVGCLT